MSPITTQSLRGGAYPAVFADYERDRAVVEPRAIRMYVDEFGLKPGMGLLDAGCGEGFWGDIFQRHGLFVWGFDVEPAYVAAGQAKYPELDLRVADAEQPLPFPLAAFDVVFCRAISHFYAPELDGASRVIKNLAGHVKQSGLLLLSVYSDGSGRVKPGVYGNPATHHPHRAFVRLVEDAGLTVAKSVSVGNYLQLGVR